MIHFSLQLVHEDLTFTAFGLYEINIPLMCSVSDMCFHFYKFLNENNAQSILIKFYRLLEL